MEYTNLTGVKHVSLHYFGQESRHNIPIQSSCNRQLSIWTHMPTPNIKNQQL